MHGNHKEQNGSHSLNRWKERLALQHRHAGMSTGSEPCILRDILSKGPQGMMTRLGSSHDEGPWTQPHIGRTPNIIVSEFSVRLHYIQCSIKATAVVQCIQLGGGQTNGQDNDPNISYCLLPTSTKCSYWQGSGPILFMYIMWPHWKENLPLLWYLGKLKFMEEIKCFVKIFVPERNQRNQSVQWNYCTHTLRLVSLWGRPEHTLHTLLPNTLHTLQETTIQPREATLQPRDFRRPPYGQETAPTVSPAYPAYPSFRQSIPMVPSIPSKHKTDYKTTRLQILPANREHNAQKRQNWQTTKASQQYRKKPSRGSLAEASNQQKGSLSCECK